MPSARIALIGFALFALASCARQEAPSTTPATVAKTTPTPKPAMTAPTTDVKKAAEGVSAVKAEDLVKQMASFYKGLKSFEVRSEMEIHVQATGMNNTMTTKTNVVFQRPNRLAMRPEGDSGPMAVTVVSDGKSLYTLLGMLKRYTKREAPKTMSQLAEDPLMGGGMAAGAPSNFLLMLLSDDPYNSFMKSVTASKDLGVATIDGRPARHLQFSQEQFDWDAWIATGPEPLLLKAAIDPSKMLKKMGQQVPGGGTMKLTMEFHYLDWKLNVAPDANAFVFTPPKDAKESKNLFGQQEAGQGGGQEEERSPLVGKAAPKIDLEALTGKRFKLADHAGKDIVMVDMWATWCPPCRRELPILVEVAHDYQSKGVAFYAVNLREDRKKVADFLKKEKLDVAVAFDKKGDVAKAYHANAIPLLVLIDKKGIIQAVHVGYNSDVKEVLHKELDGLLAGNDLVAKADEPNKPKDAKPAPATATAGLQKVWTLSGSYAGAAWDPHSKVVFALKRDGNCDVVGQNGKVKRSFKVTSEGSLLRLAHLRGADQVDLLAFGTWGRSVVALSSADGSVLWRENNNFGVDDVCAADLDGDGRDEVIIGYNGVAGLHVLTADGRPRWKATKLANVWHVAAGKINGDTTQEVVSTSATGKVNVFAADGKELATLDAPFYASNIRVMHLSKDAADTMIITGTSGGSESMAEIDAKGKALWTLELPEGFIHTQSLAVLPGVPFAALSAPGHVVVVDLVARKIVASAEMKGPQIEAALAVAEDGHSPLLVVADGHRLSAYRISEAGQKQAER
jgi:thiol-disulfide isomerase/thioredoxin